MAIKPSRRLTILLLLSHAVLAAAICVSNIPLDARLAILASILSSLLYYLARDALLLLPDSWLGIVPDRGGILLIKRGGAEFYGAVVPASVVSPYFVVLRVRLENRRFPVYLTIFPDALDVGEFRRLCVHLRFA